MPRDATTGVFTRVSNSFSNPVFGTLIDPTDAIALFDDQDVGLNPPLLAGPVRVVNSLQLGTTGTAAGSLEFFNATSGSVVISPPAGALGSVTMTLPDATDTFVGRQTTDNLLNKTYNKVTITAPATSATLTLIDGTVLTGPAATDTLVGRNSTDTLTNKTLTSPTLTTPSLGVATATSINKVTITAPATSATLTIPDGVTLTGPAASGTAMTLGNAETVSGVKAFASGSLRVNGASSGQTIINATAVASGTLTFPAATDTLVGKATTDTFTNKTFNSAGTGNVLQVSGVTVSAGQYPGETSTGSATAGNVGEYVEAILASGSATSLTTATPKTITSISLTAGDWDVDCVIYFIPAATTSVTLVKANLSLTTNTNSTSPGAFVQEPMAAVVSGGPALSVSVPPYRFSLSGTTSIFLVADQSFTVSTMTGFGIIRARRAR